MIPDGNGLYDHLAFGLAYPDHKIVFRDRDGKETELSRAELWELANAAMSILRCDETVKKPRGEPF